MKEISNKLAMAGHLVTKDNFAMHLLPGLLAEYDPIITNINFYKRFYGC